MEWQNPRAEAEMAAAQAVVDARSARWRAEQELDKYPAIIADEGERAARNLLSDEVGRLQLAERRAMVMLHDIVDADLWSRA